VCDVPLGNRASEARKLILTLFRAGIEPDSGCNECVHALPIDILCSGECAQGVIFANALLSSLDQQQHVGDRPGFRVDRRERSFRDITGCALYGCAGAGRGAGLHTEPRV